jgi:hypothetical protein
MANLTAGRNYRRQEGKTRPYKVAASTKLYGGSSVSLNAAGFAKLGADTASEKFVGVARDLADNSTGANGDKDVVVWANGVFDFAFSGTAVQANVGLPVYLVDDNTVALAATTTNDLLVGRIVEFISASKVRVAITPDA